MTDRIDTAQEREKLADLEGHTPGPWKAWQPRNDESVPVRTDGLGITIAYVHQGAITNAIANARLIATAPDLLALAHSLLDALDAERARAEKAEAERDQALARLAVVERKRMDQRVVDLNAEALAEIKATLDGHSEQSVHEIMAGLLQGLEALPPRGTTSDAEAALQRVVDATWNEAVETCAAVFDTHGDSAATEALGQVLCCHGYLCGCQGATVGEYLEHLMRALKRPEASHE